MTSINTVENSTNIVQKKCKSILFGQLKDWKCKYPAGHDGPHAADRFIKDGWEQIVIVEKYCTWTDEDSDYTLGYKFMIAMRDR